MKLKYIITAIALIAISFTALFLSSLKENALSPEERKRGVPFATTSVDIPSSVEFCSQKVDLTRFDMRERYDREINSFTYLHSTTMLLIKKANRYFPIIEPILQENNIPDDFKYLAVIESSLDERAISKAKAVGLWQFMEDTGRIYGLEINTQVDERYHIVKSTQAACRYLSDAYRKYGDWVSVAASYNGGMGRISSELSKQQVDSAFDLLLVEETSRYVFRIMAMKEIFSNPYKYGFILKKENLYPTIETQTVKVSQDILDFADFARKYDINYYLLKTFNPWLRDRGLKTNGRTYLIDIPVKENMYYDTSRIKVHNKAWIAD